MSTPGPPRSGPRLWVVLACEDDPKLCTARHLLRLGLAREAVGGTRPPPGSLLLDPHADLPVLAGDASPRGVDLVAVDCSWNRLGDRGAFPPPVAARLRGLSPRRLPFLLAANPQHYGRLGELNTAEALGAALRLTQGEAAARRYFERLAGGTHFLELNAGPLGEYAEARSPEELAAVERRYFG